MEKLAYTIEDSTIAELLGLQNFTSKEAAILELVKNAYDANAKNVILKFEKKADKKMALYIIDDGQGMDKDDIVKKWMHVGKSFKDYLIENSQDEKRVYSGSKGVGRFALARLGSEVRVITKKSKKMPLIWFSDWTVTWFERTGKGELKTNGTKIEVSGLRDSWNKTQVIKLQDYLSRVYNNSYMKIEITLDDNSYKVEKIWDNIEIGNNYVSAIHLKYDCVEKKVSCYIESDEFLDKVSKIVKPININKCSKEINMINYLSKSKESIEIKQSREEDLNKLGNFSADFYFSLDRVAKPEQFNYKYDLLPNRVNKGIILYRNDFGIANYTGLKDWIGLDVRARKSPAAATHPTGRWRVRSNQLSGKIHLDKKENVLLEELSNRQGLNENEYYELFVEIVTAVIDAFEDYRQSIIRKIKPPEIDEEEVALANKILKTVKAHPQKIKQFSEKELKQLASAITTIESSSKHDKEAAEQFKYDVRILNVLATAGLKATSLAHEYQNEKNNLKNAYKYIVKALKDYGYWKELNSLEKTKRSYRNVPAILKQIDGISHKLVLFMDVMLAQVEKKFFKNEKLNIEELIAEIIKVWKNDYSWIEIISEGDSSLEYMSSKDTFRVIFDNLILNSIQQNDKSKELIITINYKLEDNKLIFFYKDNGVGLNLKYKSDPNKILEVHETSRENGHGLGMWMINNTLKTLKGEVTNIISDNGFGIEFYIQRHEK